MKDKHIPIGVGYIFNGNFKYYFGQDCLKRFTIDRLTIQTEQNFKYNKPMMLTEEDILYHWAVNPCPLSKKEFVQNTVAGDSCIKKIGELS